MPPWNDECQSGRPHRYARRMPGIHFDFLSSRWTQFVGNSRGFDGRESRRDPRSDNLCPFVTKQSSRGRAAPDPSVTLCSDRLFDVHRLRADLYAHSAQSARNALKSLLARAAPTAVCRALASPRATRTAASGSAHRSTCVAAPRRQHQIDAERRKLTRNGRADAAGCAGHQRALAEASGCVCTQVILLVA